MSACQFSSFRAAVYTLCQPTGDRYVVEHHINTVNLILETAGYVNLTFFKFSNAGRPERRQKSF